MKRETNYVVPSLTTNKFEASSVVAASVQIGTCPNEIGTWIIGQENDNDWFNAN